MDKQIIKENAIEIEEKKSLLSNWHGKRYYSLDSFLKHTFGEKVYRLSLDGGMTCPNRDGTLGTGGCIFCSAGGSGEFAADKNLPIHEQIAQAKERIAAKTNCRRFIAYFQAYSNTYESVSYLKKLYEASIEPEEIVALSIGTRCDCFTEEIYDLLEQINQRKPVWVELGLQTIHDGTHKYLRTGICYRQFENCVKELSQRGIQVVVHLILGLPGEDQEMMLASIQQVCKLPIQGLKLQLLHVLRGTALEADYNQNPFYIFEKEEYCDFIVDCIEQIPKHIVIHRITGDGSKKLLVAPLWSGDKKGVLNRIHQIMKMRDTYQGRLYK